MNLPIIPANDEDPPVIYDKIINAVRCWILITGNGIIKLIKINKRKKKTIIERELGFKIPEEFIRVLNNCEFNCDDIDYYYQTLTDGYYSITTYKDLGMKNTTQIQKEISNKFKPITMDILNKVVDDDIIFISHFLDENNDYNIELLTESKRIIILYYNLKNPSKVEAKVKDFICDKSIYGSLYIAKKLNCYDILPLISYASGGKYTL